MNTAQDRIDWCDDLTKQALENLHQIAKEATGTASISEAVRAWATLFEKAAAERRTANLTEALNAYMAGMAPDLDGLDSLELSSSTTMDFTKVLSTIKSF